MLLLRIGLPDRARVARALEEDRHGLDRGFDPGSLFARGFHKAFCGRWRSGKDVSFTQLHQRKFAGRGNLSSNLPQLGSVTVNVAPVPSSLAAWMLPPCDCTIAFVIAKPSPVCPLFPVRALSAR